MGLTRRTYVWIEQLTRVLLLLMQQTGMVTAEEVQGDTLAERMRQEAVEKGLHLSLTTAGGCLAGLNIKLWASSRPRTGTIWRPCQPILPTTLPSSSYGRHPPGRGVRQPRWPAGTKQRRHGHDPAAGQGGACPGFHPLITGRPSGPPGAKGLRMLATKAAHVPVRRGDVILPGRPLHPSWKVEPSTILPFPWAGVGT